MNETQGNRLAKRNRYYWMSKGIPVSALLELTPRCTLDCKMCYVHLRPEQMGGRKELSAEQWIRIIDEAVKEGLLYVVLTGGECMLHPNFWEIYEHLLDSGVVVTVNTNAYTLTDADLAHFSQRKPAGFRVTVYGASEEGYERCTGRRAFQRVKENIEKLRDAGFFVSLAVTLSPWTAEEFAESFRFCKSLGLPTKAVLDLSEPNEDTGRSLEEILLTPDEQVRQIRRTWELNGFQPHQNTPITEIPPLLPDAPDCVGMHCSSGMAAFVVQWDGSMAPCFDFKYSVPVLELGFRAAWDKLHQAALKQIQPVECVTCQLRSVCHACVFHRMDPNNPGHRDPRCCESTIKRYNAGLLTLKQEAGREAEPDLAPELC